MVEDLAAGTRSLYEQAEQRLLGIIARQLADGLDAPGWVERKLGAMQAMRRASERWMLRCRAARVVRHYWRANKLWSGSYFAGTVDGAPLSAVKQYIEQQNQPV
ncbi:transposase [Streptomyces lutosisoli]|uniref:Transposase n=2 Tax=Streptomyces lutosisoli TaxID=2665721 RepID=A0ABW2VTZ2_9ACTN